MKAICLVVGAFLLIVSILASLYYLNLIPLLVGYILFLVALVIEDLLPGRQKIKDMDTREVPDVRPKIASLAKSLRTPSENWKLDGMAVSHAHHKIIIWETFEYREVIYLSYNNKRIHLFKKEEIILQKALREGIKSLKKRGEDKKFLKGNEVYNSLPEDF